MGVTSKNGAVAFLLFKFFLEFAFSAGFFAATSLFISRVGTFSLFYIYFGSSVLALGMSYGFSKIIDRYSRKRIFYGSFLILGVLVLSGWAVVQFLPDWKPIYFILRIFCYSVLVLTGLEFWVLASLTFTHAASKKIFSKLAVVTILGEMLGGLFTGLASTWLGTETLLLIWGVLLCAIPFLFVRFSFPRPETAGFSTGIIWGEVQAPGTGLRSRAFLSSRFIQLLLVSWVGYSFICYGSDYAFNSYAAEHIRGEDALTAFFGNVSAAASFVVLGYHLVIGPKLTDRLAPTSSLFLFAAIMLLPWLVFMIHPSLVTIAIADSILFYFSDHYATGIHSTILTVFPERVKGRIRVLTEGLGRPLGTVLLFLTAAVFAFQVSIEQIQYWILAAIGVLLAFPLFFRKPYAQHLLNCLHSRDSSLVLNSVQALSESPQAEAIEPLVSLLNESRSTELRRSAVWALERIPDPEAMRKVQPYLTDSGDPLHATAIEGLRHSPAFQAIYTLLGLLRKGGSGDEELRSRTFQILKDRLGNEGILLFLSYLYDANPEVQADALKALAGYKKRSLIPIFSPLLGHASPRVRANAAIALYPFARSREQVRRSALAEIERLVSSSELGERLAAYEAIGDLRLRTYQNLLQEALRGREPREILGVAFALAQMGDSAFIGPYLLVLLDEDEGLAVLAAKKLVKIPSRSRKMLFNQVEKLADAQAIKIRSRLRKAPADFFRDLRGERESMIEAQVPI